VPKLSFKEKLHHQSEKVRHQALELPPGAERDALVKKARQLDTASHMEDWLSSAELKPPN
jgi:hypothetical protein